MVENTPAHTTCHSRCDRAHAIPIATALPALDGGVIGLVALVRSI